MDVHRGNDASTIEGGNRIGSSSSAQTAAPAGRNVLGPSSGLDHERNMATTAEAIYIAKNIAGGSKNRRHRHGENFLLSSRPPLGITPYTGAAIKFLGTITRWERKVFLDCKESFADAQAEIEVEDEGVTGNTGQEDESRERRIPNIISESACLRRCPSQVQSDPRLEGLSGNRDGEAHKCRFSSRVFRREKNFVEHEESCEVENGYR